jgi:hypothetical protein
MFVVPVDTLFELEPKMYADVSVNPLPESYEKRMISRFGSGNSTRKRSTRKRSSRKRSARKRSTRKRSARKRSTKRSARKRSNKTRFVVKVELPYNDGIDKVGVFDTREKAIEKAIKSLLSESYGYIDASYYYRKKQYEIKDFLSESIEKQKEFLKSGFSKGKEISISNTDNGTWFWSISKI